VSLVPSTPERARPRGPPARRRPCRLSGISLDRPTTRRPSPAPPSTASSPLTINWHLLSDPDARHHDLGPDYYQSKINKQRRERELIRQLEDLTGQRITLTAAA